MSEIYKKLGELKKNFNKELSAKLRKIISVQYEISGEDFWSIIINNKEFNIINGKVDNPSIKFTFRDSMSFLKYLKKEMKDLRGWMNEYYRFEGSPGILSIYNSIINFPTPSQWQSHD